MKRSTVVALAALVLLVAGLAWWWTKRGASDTPAESQAPVATVKTALPKVQDVPETLTAVGDVTAGQTSGLSFPRAGQVTALNVVLGDKFSKGTVLATLTPDPAVKQAYQAALDAAGLARREWDRQRQLLASHLATQSQVDAAEKAYRDAEGAVKALDQQGGGTAVSALSAPFDGVVTAVTAVQGDRVPAGAPVLQVGRADLLRVLVGIEPADRARLHLGTPVTIWPVVGPAVDPKPIALKLSEIQDAVDPKTQLINVGAMLPRSFAGALTPGMKARAVLQVGSLSAVALPRNAVLSDEKGDYVYQVAGGKAQRVAVTKKLDNGAVTAVDGLKNLQLPVVVEGNYELQDGMAVKEAAK